MMARGACALIVALSLCFFAPLAARAACLAPAGVEGEMVYNGAHKLMQYCDGSQWIGIGWKNPAAVPDCNVGDFLMQGQGGWACHTPGMVWQAQDAAEANTWMSVAYGNGIFVAVSGNGANRVMTSPDGMNWTARPVASTRSWNKVAFGNGIFVAGAGYGGSGAPVMTSTDGIDWTPRSPSGLLQFPVFTFGNGMFVGITGGIEINRSTDGINWAGASLWPEMMPEINRLTYGNGLFVGVGYDAVTTSPDGLTWTSHDAPTGNWQDVAYGNGTFVAVGGLTADAVMTSPDGINWTKGALAVSGLNWRAVTFGGGVFVALANMGYPHDQAIMTSPDGINWTIRTNPAPGSMWTSVVHGGGKFVAVAQSGAKQVMTFP